MCPEKKFTLQNNGFAIYNDARIPVPPHFLFKYDLNASAEQCAGLSSLRTQNRFYKNNICIIIPVTGAQVTRMSRDDGNVCKELIYPQGFGVLQVFISVTAPDSSY